MFYYLPQCCRSHADVADIPKSKGMHFEATVTLVSVYDGDTIWVSWYDKNFGRVVKVSCRLLGYDAPEMKPPRNAPNRTVIIENAKKAKDVALGHFPKGRFKVQILGTDKYGRWLLKDEVLKQKLLGLGLAYEYGGGTKRAAYGNAPNFA